MPSSAALSSLVGLALVGQFAPALAQTQEQAPSRIDRMALSSGGVAEVHSVADVDGDATLSIQVPLAQVNDVLKSLLVRDPGGTLESVTLDGLSPVEETFSTLPFSAKNIASLPELLQHLVGTRVRAASGGRVIEGAVLGTETTQRRETNGEVTSESRLSVLTEEKRIDVLRLGADATLDILDTAMRDRFAGAVSALGKAGSDQMRTLSVVLKGTGKRTVSLSYITAAPIWKPAFRVVLGKDNRAHLQGWAVLENATGQDWKTIDLTLMSGAPVTLTQKLHERYWPQRPDLPVFVGASAVPRTDTSAALAAKRVSQSYARGGGDSRARADAMDMPAASAEMAMARPAPAPMIAAPAMAAVAQENMTNVSFHLAQPVTLARGQSLSLPFVDADVPAEKLAVFQPEMNSINPVSAVMLKNTSNSSLPPGILTVFDSESGFVGDAAMPALPAGESRLASFAADRKVEVTFDTSPQERITNIKVSEGILQVETLSRLLVNYTIKGATDAPRTVIIEHPKRAGWTTRSDKLDSTTATHYRIRVDVAAGAVAKVAVTDEIPGTEAFSLADADAQSLLVWANAPSTPALSAKLKKIAQDRAALTATERKLADIDAKLEQLTETQSRLRENLGAVPAESELARRYMGAMTKSENAIDTLTTQREQVSASFTAQNEAFMRAISDF